MKSRARRGCRATWRWRPGSKFKRRKWRARPRKAERTEHNRRDRHEAKQELKP